MSPKKSIESPARQYVYDDMELRRQLDSILADNDCDNCGAAGVSDDDTNSDSEYSVRKSTGELSKRILPKRTVNQTTTDHTSAEDSCPRVTSPKPKKKKKKTHSAEGSDIERIYKSESMPYTFSKTMSCLREPNGYSALPFRTDLVGKQKNSCLYVYNALKCQSYLTPMRSLTSVKIRNGPSHCAFMYLGSFILSENNAQAWRLGSKHECYVNLV